MRPAFLLATLLLLALPGSTLPGTPQPAATTERPLRLPAIRLHGDALAGGERRLAIGQLDALASPVTWRIWDSYRRREVQFTGIPLATLVKAVAPGARQVRMRAVNDYVTVFERSEWEKLPILLATRDDGARMSVAHKGPARIVFLQTPENELSMQVYAPKWIWQVVDVEFAGN